jgi:hypothetical protein
MMSLKKPSEDLDCEHEDRQPHGAFLITASLNQISASHEKAHARQ